MVGDDGVVDGLDFLVAYRTGVPTSSGSKSASKGVRPVMRQRRIIRVSIDVSAETATHGHRQPALKILQPSQVTPEPWANGGGRTRTLLAWPDPGHWAVRISVADVEKAGPFSVFAGVDRWFAVLEGDGVDLTTGGQAPVVVRAADEEMHAFPGDDATDCALLGEATRDLNVMVRRGEARATIRRLRDGGLRSNAECSRASCATMRSSRTARARRSHSHRIHSPGSKTVRVDSGAQLAAPAPRGWWIEANRTARDDDQAD